MDAAFVGSIARTVLTTAGGALVTQGLVSEESLNSYVGAVIVLVTGAWSIWQKRQAAKALRAAELAPAKKA